MNTHDKYELPELPEWADRTLQGDWRDEIISWGEQAIEPYAKRIAELEAQIEADRQRRGEPVDLDRYDAGLLGGQDGMPAYVWHDIIRAELDRAYDFYMDQLDRATPQPAEPVKRKRRYAQGTALGEFGIIPMCDQVDDEPVKVASDLPVTEQEEDEWRRMEASRD